MAGAAAGATVRCRGSFHSQVQWQLPESRAAAASIGRCSSSFYCQVEWQLPQSGAAEGSKVSCCGSFHSQAPRKLPWVHTCIVCHASLRPSLACDSCHLSGLAVRALVSIQHSSTQVGVRRSVPAVNGTRTYAHAICFRLCQCVCVLLVQPVRSDHTSVAEARRMMQASGVRPAT